MLRQPAWADSAARRGSALIIVLAFLSLLSGLVLAMLARTQSERRVADNGASQVKAALLAQSALDVIVGDLREEILAGSTLTNVGGTTLYFPRSPTNMVPAPFVGGDGINPYSSGSNSIPNLIRRSMFHDPLSALSPPLVEVPATQVSSTNLSANGRSVTLQRWNAHYLIPRARPGGTLPDATPTSGFIPPDWVSVVASGPTNLAAPNRAVIGRYAYAIYDEGGLLDANVAGYPSGMTTATGANLAAEKGSLAFADLTAIGLTNSGSVHDVDNLVGWRNYATVRAGSQTLAGNYDFSSDAGVSSNYFAYVTGATNGFLTVSAVANGNRSDQMFTSRQALLKFQRAVGFSQDALQYLGTFSRDLEQPSFIPDPARPKNVFNPPTSAAGSYKAGGNDAYDAAGTAQDLINPSLLAVRDSSGAPVLKRRFPLSRLALVAPASAGANAALLQQYFGLSWDAANGRWAYNHGDPAKIYKLSEIPNGREPDFFETLKAAIDCDSLGKQHGGLGGNNSPHLFTPGNAAIDSSVNYQIIQIGANLIDQYDSDSYPTRIFFDSREFYGIENLPYLYGWMTAWYRMKQLGAGDIMPTMQPPAAAAGRAYPCEMWTMIQPILWNPHNTNAATAATPASFKIVAGGVANTAVTIRPLARASWWVDGAVSTYPAAGGMTTSSFSDATLDPALSAITFGTTPTGPASFREPYRLRSPGYPSGSNTAPGPGYAAGTFTLAIPGDLSDSDGSYTQALGFFAGKAWAGPSGATSTYDASSTLGQKCLSYGYFSTDFKMQLQYANPYGSGPAFLTYDTMENVYVASLNTSTIDNLDTPGHTRGLRTSFRADPRTDRWGTYNMNTYPDVSQLGANPSGIAEPPFDGVNGPIYYLPQGATTKPDSTFTYRMTGNGAAGPQAPGWMPTYMGGTNSFPPSEHMVNLTSDTSANPNVGVKKAPGNVLALGGKLYYTDPDGVLRRAAGGGFSGNDGLPLYTGNYASRPVVLDRPFRSVAEMGYAFQGVPWRELDFANPESGDSALLDAFCLNEQQNAPADVAVAGRVNLNTRQPKVLEALLRGVSKEEGGTLSNAEAVAAAQALVSWTHDPSPARGPLRNRAELVGKWVSTQTFTNPAANFPNIEGSKSYSGYASVLSSNIFSSSSDASIERRREAVVRALADSGNVRTWNLLIDVIAQTGQYPASAVGSGDLSQFIVQGEAHLWIHLAIDRLTGEIVDKQIEPVSE